MIFHLSPTGFDPADAGPRRMNMYAYFEYMVPGVPQEVYDELRQKAVDMVRESYRIDCSAYKTSFIAYMVDLVFWNMWCTFTSQVQSLYLILVQSRDLRGPVIQYPSGHGLNTAG